MRLTRGEKVFQVFNIILLSLLVLTIILPFMHVVSLSLSSRQASGTMSIGLWPDEFNIKGYYNIIKEPTFFRSMLNTIFVTVAGTILSLFATLLLAYCMTRSFFGKTFVKYYFVLTMYFSGGMIPAYLLISRYLQWNNTYWPYIIPAMVSVYYSIIIRTQIEVVPSSLTEAAYIDGASEFKVLTRVVIPTILPTLAAISMFFALGHWNQWYSVMLYSRDNSMWTLQYFLRVVVFDKFIGTAQNFMGGTADLSDTGEVSTQNYQMACVVIVALPIVAIYPFIQKYFVKGILAGSVKE